MLYENKYLKVDLSGRGGFPSRIDMKLPDGDYAVLHDNRPALEIVLGNGQTVSPVLPDGYSPDRYKLKNCERIQFDRLPFHDQLGRVMKDFYLTIRYEFWDDGTVFGTSYFVCEDYSADFSIRGYRFNYDLDLSEFEQFGVPFGEWADLSGTASTLQFRNQKFDGIRENFNFSCKRKDGLGIYAEVFMEEADSLAREKSGCATEFKWSEKHAGITWDFQNVEAKRSRNFEWAELNSWGFLFRASPTERRNPPLRMYHLIDNYEERMPSLRTLKLMADAGADVIVIHEGWRSDPVNFAVPWDPSALKKFIEEAHKLNIRIALYIRGHDELTTMEDYCDWFAMYLKPNWDGLYADFGGVSNGLINGKKRFRMHYLKMRKIRDTIGEYGLFYSHSGMLYSAVGMTPELIDGYTSGEGERGALGSERFMHEYVSGSYITTGTFWTAAYPHYSDGRMVPFMAATGQYPHAPLGTQWKSSSLSHPGVPGINDLYLRPLWKIWGCFKFMRKICFYTDFNSCSVIRNPDPALNGAFLEIAPEKKCALLLLSNFSNSKREVSVSINWSDTGFEPDMDHCSIYRLCPDQNSPGKAEKYDSWTDFSLHLPANGVGGFLIGEPELVFEMLKDFEKPYPLPSKERELHLQTVAEQRRLRMPSASPVSDLYMKLVMPETHVPFICGDIFHSLEHQIGFTDPEKGFVQLGYISKKGFSVEKPTDVDWIWAEEESPWISLRDLFPEGGIYTVVIRSFCVKIGAGIYFHSLHEAIISPEPDEHVPGTYRLTYYNEVEPDRENFHFSISLTPTGNRI